MALMFIGGASGSTAGGIKVNTFSVLLVAIVSTVRGRPSAEAFGRRIPHDLIYRALSVALLSIAIIFVVALALELTTPIGIPSSQVLFETISAFGTVGASTGHHADAAGPGPAPADRRDVRRAGSGPSPSSLPLLPGHDRRVPAGRRDDAHRMTERPTTGRRPAMKPSVLVVGLGRFGTAAALELMALGHEVLAVDRRRGDVNDVAPDVTHAVAARRDRRERPQVRRGGRLRVRDRRHQQLDRRQHLRDHGAQEPGRVRKSSPRPRPSSTARSSSGSAPTACLRRERRWATRVAHSLSIPGVIDYIDVAPRFGIVKIRPPERSSASRSRSSTCSDRLRLSPSRCGGPGRDGQPHRDVVIAATDELILMGRDAELEQIER